MLEFCYFCGKLTLDNVQWGIATDKNNHDELNGVFPIAFPNKPANIFYVFGEYKERKSKGEYNTFAGYIKSKDKNGFTVKGYSAISWWIAVGN